MKTERMDVGRTGVQYGKPTTGHPTSPAMPSPLTPVDGSSFYPTATDVDCKGLVLSPRFNDVKPIAFSAPTGPEPAAVVAPYSQFQLQVPPPAARPLAVQPQPACSTAASLLSDLDDIDALQCQWDMKHFEPGKLTESDLICLDTPASAAPPPVSTVATTVFTAFSSAPALLADTVPDPPPSFSVFSNAAYHPYYQPPPQQQQQQPQQQIFSPEFNLDYSTPEVKELLCTGWLESDLLNVN